MTCSRESFEEGFHEGQYGRWFYETILKKKPKLYDKLELDPPKGLSSLKALNTISTPRGIQSLVKFYENLNQELPYSKAFKDYLDAVKDGLFATIYIQAYYLRRVLDKYSNLEEFYKKSYSDSFPLIKELISLVECGLYPVCQWSVDARENRKAHVYLEKIGNQLNPVKPGKQSKRPYLYEIALFILYYVLLDEFKKAMSSPRK
jgi:hypothetical protein